jgi:hypothetical protein
MRITNLTTKQATSDLRETGTDELSPEAFAELTRYLTFTEAPTTGMLKYRAKALCLLAMEVGNRLVLLDGVAPFLTSLLEAELRSAGMVPVYYDGKDLIILDA